MTKNITITNFEALNITSWNAQLSEEKRNALPMKVRFYLKKFLGKILPDVKQFEEFRDSELKVLQDEYFGEEKSYEKEQPKKDEQGNEITDDDGVIETETVRVVKDEYIAEYQDKINTLNEKLMEILNEKNTYEVSIFDVADFVEKLPEDTPIEFDDINIIDAIFSAENEEG